MDGPTRLVLLGFRAAILCSLFVVFAPQNAKTADWSKSLSSEAVSSEAQDQTVPEVAFGQDVFLVVWEHEYSAEDHDVYFRLTSAIGAPSGSSIAVATSARWEGSPAVAHCDDTGNFLVVWEEVTLAGDRDIRGQIYGSDGSAVGEALEIATGTSEQLHPVVAWGDARWLVVWHEQITASPLDNDLHAILLQNDGTPDGSEIVLASEDSDESAPAVAWGDDRFLVAWQDAAAGEYDVVSRTVTTGGGLGSTATLADWEYDQIRPAVSYSPESESYLVVWEDHHWGFGEDWDIFGRRVSASGVALGDLVSISWLGSAPRTAPAIAYDSGNAEYQVAWAYEPGEGNRDLWHRRVSPGAALIGSESSLAALETDETEPALAGDGQYGYLFVWEDARDSGGTGLDIYAEFVEQFRLSGRVYAGSLGDTSSPLPGVTVELYCSQNQGERESLVESAVTDANGWWGLKPTAACEYHELWMVDPQYHLADGASSVDGVVLAATWIEYPIPLRDKTLTGNLFFTVPQDPAPEPWVSFSPSDWWNTSLTVPVSVQISDFGSGLDVDSALYRVSTDGGSVWGDWSPASCSGADGSKGPETVSTSILFEGDSGTLYWVQFAVSDMAMQRSESPVYPVKVDTTPPQNPPAVNANLSTSTWYGDADITLSWQPATDATSGVAGYSLLWDTSATTVPDTTVEDQDNHIEDLIPGHGQSWNFHLRTVDQAGNAAAGGVHTGPYWLDTTPPSNPAIQTCSPQPFNWSTSSTVSCTWTAGADTGSGIGGYSYDWTASPGTLPDTSIDTVLTSGSSPILANGSWYLHLRSVDTVGNGANTAIHGGPFLLDREPPYSAVNPLTANQTTATFPVSWSGGDGTGSGIVSYDVRVEDLTAGTTTTWKSATSLTADSFTGQGGHTYLFSSRARDLAGNLESYPAAGGDALTTVGTSIPIRVRNQSGAAVSGARVYHNGAYVGVTDASGLRYVPGAIVGDEVAAIYEVYEHAATKLYHTSYGSGNWSWRVYQTSWGFSAAGVPQLHAITGTGEQTLTVRADQPLIGIHHITSLEFDASAHLTYAAGAMQIAATLLYDATDGQFVFEINEFFDNGVHWLGCDMQIHASNTGRANASRRGIELSATEHINMSRGSPINGWSGPGGDDVIVHEWGHYGMGLWDEYLDRAGQDVADGYCATNRLTTAYESRASVMDHDATEFCSLVDPNHKHRTNTQHDKESGGKTTWESIKAEFTDTQNPPRWILETPDDRGAMMTGPTAIPIDLVKYYSTDANTGACAQFALTVNNHDGTSARDAEVTLIRSSGLLPQGLVRQNGIINIVGAHTGEMLLATLDGSVTFAQIASCGATTLTFPAPGSKSADEGVAKSASGPHGGISIAATDGDTIEIAVFRGDATTPPSVARLIQEGAEPMGLDLAWDAGRSAWLGTVDLDPTLEATGYVDIRYEVGESLVSADIESFTIHALSTETDNTRLMSDDGTLEIVIPASSLEGQAWVTIATTEIGARFQGDLRQVGPSYGVHLSSHQAGFDPPVVVNFRWDERARRGSVAETNQVYRWNADLGIWELVGGEADPDHDMVSTEVDRLSVFAVFGRDSGVFSDGFESGGPERWSSTNP